MDVMDAVFPYLSYAAQQAQDAAAPSADAGAGGPSPAPLSSTITITWNPSQANFPERNLGKVASYVLSHFALACIAMAVILNRTAVFASTRRPQPLSFWSRGVLHGSAALALFLQIRPLLAGLLYNNRQCISRFFLAKSRPLLLRLFAVVVNWVVRPGPDAGSGGGHSPPLFAPASPHILWWVYLAICLAHFVETFCGSLEARPITTETGLTLFEYSVIFHESQLASALSNQMLVLSLCACLSHLSLHLQSIFNSYRYRLWVSSLFGGSFLAYFAWSIYQGSVFAFPTVCILGYLPQLIMCGVVLICMALYALARLTSGCVAENMRNSLHSVNIEPTDDFYRCLMKFGIISLTSATRATYLSETPSLYTTRGTWLDHSPEFQSAVRGYANEQKDLSLAALTKLDTATDIPTRYSIGSRTIMTFSLLKGTLRVLFRILFGSMSRLWVRCLHTAVRPPAHQPSHPDPDQDDSESEEAMERLVETIRDKMIFSRFDKGDVSYHSLLLGDDLPDIDQSRLYEDSLGVQDDSDLVGVPQHDSESLGIPDSEDTAEDTTEDTDDTAAEDTDDTAADTDDTAADTDDSEYHPGLAEIAQFIAEPLDLLMANNEDMAILASHMTRSNAPMTRSKHRQRTFNEVRALIRLIADRRDPAHASHAADETLCVICHCSPRQIVLWPCRCFALCEDCRMTLAFQHFKGCVCCRRPVESFSRVFVP